ncbi:hypothetical protein [Sphingomonas sp. CCH5-D11]|uniref:hypothetical protein n=1 Tax=Sphingomonas sp. CCH5-D11 TaxID=1768786 RepID=UPI003FA76C0E
MPGILQRIVFGGDQPQHFDQAHGTNWRDRQGTTNGSHHVWLGGEDWESVYADSFSGPFRLLEPVGHGPIW